MTVIEPKMRLTVTKSHQGEGQFPLFPKGSVVNIKAECSQYPNWLACEIAGYDTYVPRHFVEQNQLVRDYNPTELVVTKNEIVELLELYYEWALVQRNDEVGWLPCEILVSKKG